MNYRIDSHKLHFHPKRVVQWREADTWEKAKEVFPIYVEISPAGGCNHSCTFCAVDYIGYKSRMLDTENLKETIFEMSGLGVKSVMFAGEGEPLLHQDMDEINDFSAIHLDTAFTTNGVLLNKLETIDQCTWVRISVNGGTKKTYATIHRTKDKDWDTVWTNIAKAAIRKGNCALGVQTLLLPEVLPEIQQLYDRCNDLGVDYLIVKPYSQHKFSFTHKYEKDRPDAPDVKERSCKFIFREQTYETQSIPNEKCHATPNFWAYIMASGDVYSCSAYLLDERFRLGNIQTQSFNEIWQGALREANWHFVRETIDISECRVNCRMARVNEYLEELKAGPVGVNFI